MRRIKKGDEVIVIAGKDKGKRGSVLRVLGDEKFIVENVNIIKRHTKPNPRLACRVALLKVKLPLQVSNVMLFNAQTKKGDRVGIRTLEDGRKVRYFKSTNEVVDI